MNLNYLITYDVYNYDELLDTYNETNEKKYLIYCYCKINNLSLEDIGKLLKLNMYETLFSMLNIQRTIDNENLYYDYITMFEQNGINYELVKENGELDIYLIDKDDEDWDDDGFNDPDNDF